MTLRVRDSSNIDVGRPLPSADVRGICANDRGDERCRLQRDEHAAGERRDATDVSRGGDTKHRDDDPQRDFVWIAPRLDGPVDRRRP